MIWPIALYSSAPVDGFIPTIESMEDIKGDIVYVDREARYFLIIENGIFYIGYPIGKSQILGADVSYTWGRVADCSTSTFSCVGIGAQAFVLPNEPQAMALSVGETLISAWPREGGRWAGAGVRCAYSPQSSECRLLTTYQYDVNEDGVVSQISITQWMIDGKNYNYSLKLESQLGIKL